MLLQGGDGALEEGRVFQVRGMRGRREGPSRFFRTARARRAGAVSLFMAGPLCAKLGFVWGGAVSLPPLPVAVFTDGLETLLAATSAAEMVVARYVVGDALLPEKSVVLMVFVAARVRAASSFGAVPCY